MPLQVKLRFIIAALFLAVLLVWAVYFAYTSRFLVSSAEQSAVQAAGHVIGVLEEQFLELEHISFALNQSEAVREFSSQRDLLAYHEKAAAVYDLLAGMQERAEFVEHLIIFSDRDVYYRFWGSMGNTAAAKVYYAISPTEQPRELVLTLEGMPYIGYTSGIYHPDGQPLGVIVLLIEESKLRDLFVSYRANDALQISLAVDERIITSSEPALVNASAAERMDRATFAESRKVGFTPFEILVTVDDSHNRRSLGAFALTAAFTAAIFAVLFLLFTRALDRSFFAPMLDIMLGVERLGTGAESSLPAYREESFDRLAGKINDMLRRLDERNRELFDTERRLQQAEISKQKAIIVSLKKQISAHFTVNVLSVIKRFAELGEMKKTGDMCDGLSHLLRYANAGDEFIGGLEEFFVLRKYVDIMQIRYEGRFQVDFDPDERLGDVSIPRMLVQPLIENAILHGFQKRKAGGRLSVKAQMDGNRLVIVVEDNGVGMDDELLARLRGQIAGAEEQDAVSGGLEHVALVNIQRRVRSYYGAGSGLHIDSAIGRGTTATLILDQVAGAQ